MRYEAYFGHTLAASFRPISRACKADIYANTVRHFTYKQAGRHTSASPPFLYGHTIGIMPRPHILYRSI